MALDMAQSACIAKTASSPAPNAFFKSIELTADSTCLITNSDDNIIRNYVLYVSSCFYCIQHALGPS